jgi:chlorobactene glucosyltransferase
MPLLIWSSIFATLVAVALARAVRQFRCYESLSDDPAVSRDEMPPVSVIVPMRNEERNIGACLTGLRAQDYPHDRLDMIVVDDNSSDGSSAIVCRHGAADGRVRLMRAGPLPAGWTGKPHACWRGALSARGEWLCFLDADTIAAPALLRAAIGGARERQLDMLSLAPFQELRFFFDRLLLPFGFLAIAATQDLARVNSAASGEATANGQCLMIRARSYFAVDGHHAVRDEICEDAALARRIKAAGYRFALLDAERCIRTRMYGSLSELWEGLSKNITEVYGGSTATLAISAAALFLGWSALPLLAATLAAAAAEPTAASIAAAAATLAADGAFFATTVALAVRLKIPWWYGLLFSLAATIGAVLALSGVLARARGRVHWKGRVYAASGTAVTRSS